MAKKIPTQTVDKALADFTAESVKRAESAKAVYAHQDAKAREAIDRMQSLLIRISRRRMRVNKTIVDIPNDAIWNNALYMAVEILKDLSYLDIRVADFNWPADLCMVCGGPVRRRKVVKRG